MAQSKVNTMLVLEKANRLELLNKALSDELESSRAIMTHLEECWESEACKQLTGTFMAFANRYFSNYQTMLKGYADYLRVYVDEGYTETENENIVTGTEFSEA